MINEPRIKRVGAKAKQEGRGQAGKSARKAQAGAQAKPRGTREGDGGQSARVPSQLAGGPQTGDDHQNGEYLPAGKESLPTNTPVQSLGPSSPESISISHYKGTSLRNIGRDKDGKVIPHTRSEITAAKVAQWVAGGYTENDVAVMLNIRPGLVRECYGNELNHGAELVGMDMTGHIIDRAKESDRMAVFFAKSRMGWRDGDQKPVDTATLNIHIHT